MTNRWGAAAVLCRWFAGVPVLSHSGVLQRWRLCSATTAHRAPPVCEWPVLSTMGLEAMVIVIAN